MSAGNRYLKCHALKQLKSNTFIIVTHWNQDTNWTNIINYDILKINEFSESILCLIIRVLNNILVNSNCKISNEMSTTLIITNIILKCWFRTVGSYSTLATQTQQRNG